MLNKGTKNKKGKKISYEIKYLLNMLSCYCRNNMTVIHQADVLIFRGQFRTRFLGKSTQFTPLINIKCVAGMLSLFSLIK